MAMNLHNSGAPIGDDPIYNIGMVAELTGISRDTLRAWERRHGFPIASRTDGGHRLYSGMDILRLQWVKEAVESGMRSSVAITALHQAEDHGDFPEAAFVASASTPPSIEGYHGEVLSLDRARDDIFDALLEVDNSRAEKLLAQVISTYPVEDVVVKIVSPLFGAIGASWSQGDISIAVEHYATQVLRNHLVSFLHTSTAPIPVEPIILACAPGDQHEGSALMFNALLRQLRWPVIYLGQAVPLADLARFAENHAHSAIVLVATMRESAMALKDLVHWFPKMDEPDMSPICFGGRAFIETPDFVDDVLGNYLGDTLQDGVKNLDELLRERLLAYH